MPALFVLLPASSDVDELFADAPAELRAARAALTLRVYPRATDASHLLSLVRAGRDPIATRWLRGTVLAVLGGAGLGAITNGVLAGTFGMFGGLLELAIPLGFVLGAFLGGFTAAMTGTEVARDEVKRLAEDVQAGDVLLQWVGEVALLEGLRDHCKQRGLTCITCGT